MSQSKLVGDSCCRGGSGSGSGDGGSGDRNDGSGDDEGNSNGNNDGNSGRWPRRQNNGDNDDGDKLWESIRTKINRKITIFCLGLRITIWGFWACFKQEVQKKVRTFRRLDGNSSLTNPPVSHGEKHSLRVGWRNMCELP